MSSLKLSYRYLLKNKLVTIINIVGLALGISASWIIFRICTFEFSHNADFKEGNKIYKVRSEFDFSGNPGNNEGVPKPLYNLVEDEIDGVEKVIPLFGFYLQNIKTQKFNGELNDEEGLSAVYTTNDFFKVFDFPIIAGDKESLMSRNKIILSEDKAEKFFGTKKHEDIIGQTFTINDTSHYQVGAVFSKGNLISDFDYTVFLPMSAETIKEDQWGNVNNNEQLFIKVKDPNQAKLIFDKINKLSTAKSAIYVKTWGENMKRWFEFTPLDEVHFMNKMGSSVRKANKNILFILVGVGFFLLLLAAINYINMSIANLPSKSKQVGLKKTLGVQSKTIFGEFFMETSIVVMMSTLLSFGFTHLFYNLYPFAIPDGLATYYNYTSIAIFLLTFLSVLILCTSIIPAIMMSKMEASEIIRNNFLFKKRAGGINFNNALVVFQFFIASVFIINGLIINKQMKHLMTFDIGFNREAIVTVPISWKVITDSLENNKKFPLKQELSSIKGIEAVSLSEALLRQGMSSNTFKRLDDTSTQEVLIQRKPSDINLLKVYDLKLVEGRFLNAGDDGRKFVINLEAVKQLGYKNPKEAIGGVIKENYLEQNAEIVGVVTDFNTMSMTTPKSPVAIMNDPNMLQSFGIKMDKKRPESWAPTLKEAEKVWSKFYPNEPFKYEYVDETVANMVKTEKQLTSLSNLAAFIINLISCLGLFGLSMYHAVKKMKEISVRKIFGASTMSLIVKISKTFLLLVLIAIVLSIPVVYFISNQFMQNYANKIEITPWYYLTGFISLMAIAFLTMLYNNLRAVSINPTQILNK